MPMTTASSVTYSNGDTGWRSTTLRTLAAAWATRPSLAGAWVRPFFSSATASAWTGREGRFSPACFSLAGPRLTRFPTDLARLNAALAPSTASLAPSSASFTPPRAALALSSAPLALPFRAAAECFSFRTWAARARAASRSACFSAASACSIYCLQDWGLAAPPPSLLSEPAWPAPLTVFSTLSCSLSVCFTDVPPVGLGKLRFNAPWHPADLASLPLVSGKLQKIRKELQNGYRPILHHFVPPVKSRISGADWTVRFTGAYLVVFSGHLGDRGTFYGAPGESAKFFPLFSSFCLALLTAPPRQFTIAMPQSEWNITGALEAFPAVMWRIRPSRSLVPDPGNAGVGSEFDDMGRCRFSRLPHCTVCIAVYLF